MVSFHRDLTGNITRLYKVADATLKIFLIE